jgi:[protein-PII] uridylyltransferase
MSEIAPALNKLKSERIELINSLCRLGGGISWCQRHTKIIDKAIITAFEHIFSTSATAEQVTIIATGGYGRREMAPYSDADIAIIPSFQLTNEIDKLVRDFFNLLNDTVQKHIGIEISYSYRPLSDIPAIDSITRSSLIDARYICGNVERFHVLTESIEKSHPKGEFLVSKIAERTQFLNNTHLTPLVSEPDVKQGAGGLRCFHTINWIRRTLGEIELKPTEEYENIISIRNLLQKFTGKKSDLLNRTRQSEIATLVSKSPVDIMKIVTSSMEAIHQQYRESLENIKYAKFVISSGVHSIQGEVRVEPGTDNGIASVGIALATNLDIIVPHFPAGTSTDLTDGSSLVHAVSTGLKTLRNLDHCGILAKALPEFEACRYLQSDDNVHTYTVYEHTLKVIEILDNESVNSWIFLIVNELSEKGILYLSALLHDIGKVDSTQPHSIVGEIYATLICKRMKLTPWQTNTITWLVKEHLTMSSVMRFRDLDQLETIAEFAKIVQTVERLNYLTALTYADIRAVSNTTWTIAQETFLRTLYDRTLSLLLSQEAPVADIALNRKQVLKMLSTSDITNEEAKMLLDQLPAYYLASTPLNLAKAHVTYVKKAKQNIHTIEINDRADLNATEFTICAQDRKALLSELLGVFYAYNLSVPSIRACTTLGENGIALDVITVSFAGGIVPPSTTKQVSKTIDDIITNRLSIEEVLFKKGKDFDRKADILSWTIREGTPTILEIKSSRGRGLPYRLSRWIALQNWGIVSARIGQWGDKASTTYYLESEIPITSELVEKAVRSIP